MGNDVDKFRPHLAKDLRESYGSAGKQSQRMFEVMARSMTNTAVVDNSNGNCGMVDGDVITLEKARFINKNKEQKIQTSYLLEGEKLSRGIPLLNMSKGRILKREDIENLKFRNIPSVYIEASSIKFTPVRQKVEFVLFVNHLLWLIHLYETINTSCYECVSYRWISHNK